MSESLFLLSDNYVLSYMSFWWLMSSSVILPPYRVWFTWFLKIPFEFYISIFFLVTMTYVRSIHRLRRWLIYAGEPGWPPFVRSPLPTTFFPSTRLEHETFLKRSEPCSTRTNVMLVEFYISINMLHQFLFTKFIHFAPCNEAKIHWQFSVYAIWCIWLERNGRISWSFGIGILVWLPFDALSMGCLVVFLC